MDEKDYQRYIADFKQSSEHARDQVLVLITTGGTYFIFDKFDHLQKIFGCKEILALLFLCFIIGLVCSLWSMRLSAEVADLYLKATSDIDNTRAETQSKSLNYLNNISFFATIIAIILAALILLYNIFMPQNETKKIITRGSVPLPPPTKKDTFGAVPVPPPVKNTNPPNKN